MLRNAKKDVIERIDQWPRPKRDYQWKPGRSAMELAASWFRSGTCACPPELAALLNSHPLTRGWQFEEGCPEFVTTLPERGEGRNHDLWLRGRCTAGALTVCVEAKADETFGARIEATIAKALRRSPDSGVPARVKALLALITGHPCDPDADPWRELRYQLLTACAGTVLQAARDGSGIGVLVVQEFTGPSLKVKRQRQNDSDLNMFVRHAFLDPGPFLSDVLAGPMPVSCRSDFPPVQLLVGKIRSAATI